VVVGPAITWVGNKYQVPIDDTSLAAQMGVRDIKNESKVAGEQRRMLQIFIDQSREVWAQYLGLPRKNNKKWLFLL
jgi:ABC-type arginine transport system permease subunit